MLLRLIAKWVLRMCVDIMCSVLHYVLSTFAIHSGQYSINRFDDSSDSTVLLYKHSCDGGPVNRGPARHMYVAVCGVSEMVEIGSSIADYCSYYLVVLIDLYLHKSV